MTADLKACVLGCGLIGGSIAAALSKSAHYQVISGWDINTDAVMALKDQQYVTEVCTTWEDAVQGADLVILGMYVQGILETLDQIGDHLKTGALVIDVGSTKEQIVDKMSQLPDHVLAVGGHPMAGKTTSGVDGVDPSLYHERVFVLCPTERTTDDAMARAHAFVDDLGAQALVMASAEHDYNVAIISHIVRLVPIAMIANANRTGNPLTWTLAAGGFRESTRTVTDDLGFWMDVFSTNRHGLPSALRSLAQELQHLANVLEAGDMNQIVQENEASKAAWLERYGADD